MNRLKEFRAIARVKQVELGVNIGIHASRLSQIECGWVRPRPDECIRIARALGVEERKIFPEN